jgi:hypothetical protein
MADLTMDRRPGAPRSRDLAIAVSVVVHGLLFLALFWKFGAAPSYPEAPVMSVELAPPWGRPASPPPRPAAPPKAKATASPVHPNLPPVLSKPATEARPADAVPQTPGAEGDARVRNALRGRVGCDSANLVNLSPAERQACLDRLAKGGGGRMPLNLDRRGDYAKNLQPYLERRPRNGCKARAGGDKAPMGEEGVAGGLSCAWSF